MSFLVKAAVFEPQLCTCPLPPACPPLILWTHSTLRILIALMAQVSQNSNAIFNMDNVGVVNADLNSRLTNTGSRAAELNPLCVQKLQLRVAPISFLQMPVSAHTLFPGEFCPIQFFSTG